MVGDKIKLLRKQRNITMKELGEELNLGESTISMYENGKRTPDYETLKKIAKYFNVSSSYLLEETNDPTPQNKKNTLSPEKLKLLDGIGYAYFGGDGKELDEADVDYILGIVELTRKMKEKEKNK